MQSYCKLVQNVKIDYFNVTDILQLAISYACTFNELVKYEIRMYTTSLLTSNITYNTV